MNQKNIGMINFKAIRFEVDNLELSIAFYQTLGCIIEDVQNSNYSISAYLRFSPNSDVLIHLMKDFRRKTELNAIEKLPTFEITSNEENENFHDEVFFQLVNNGIEYSNLKGRDNVLCAVGQFRDISGNKWELIDTFDYQLD